MKINCKKLETLWIPYLDGNLAAQERTTMDAHLAECVACAARRDEFFAVARELDRWEAPEPSPWFDSKMRARIRSEAAPAHRGWLSALTPGFPMSIAAMLLLAALLIWGGGGAGTITPPQVVQVDNQMDDLIHVIDEVELLNEADFLTELKGTAENTVER